MELTITHVTSTPKTFSIKFGHLQEYVNRHGTQIFLWAITDYTVWGTGSGYIFRFSLKYDASTTSWYPELTLTKETHTINVYTWNTPAARIAFTFSDFVTMTWVLDNNVTPALYVNGVLINSSLV